MPRNVRNFWIEGNADRAQPVGFGPQAATGDAWVTIYQRDRGTVHRAVRIVGQPRSDGSLVLYVEPCDGCESVQVTPHGNGGFKIETRR